MKKSEGQRRREEARRPDREARAAAAAAAAADRELVTVRDADGEHVVGAASFAPAPIRPPFEISPEARRAILDGLQPRISFPRPGACPTQPGDIVDISSKVAIVVVGIHETVKSWVLHYIVNDTRANQLGKGGGYTDSDSAAIATTKAIEGEGERMGGPEFRPEREPEAISRKEASDMSDDQRQARIDKLRESLKEMEASRDKLLELNEGGDIVFGVKQTIRAVEARIALIEAQGRPVERGAA